MDGTIFDIQRFCTHDGPGIRTVIFLKGCPLSCIWCHNPESHNPKNEIMYNSRKCINCKLCAGVCQNNVHTWNKATHIFNRGLCNSCNDCAEVCGAGALQMCGSTQKAHEVAENAMRDFEFFAQSGGGITLSGGEPLMQYDFSLEILKEIKKSGIHTAIETSGYCSRDLEPIAEFTDLWLYDIKLFDSREHIKYTGVSNDIILRNLKHLDELGAKIILRCPIIPDINLNEKHFDCISKLASSLNSVVGIEFEAYHPLGIEKSIQLGKVQSYANQCFLDKDEIRKYAYKISQILNTSIQ